MGSITRRLESLERRSSAMRSPCPWCEQSYWTAVSTNRAIGPYSDTEYGNEAGLVILRELSRIFGESEYGGHYPDHLPAYDLDEQHEGVIAAWDRVVESRPPRAECECFEGWATVGSVEARVLYHYPRVAKAMVEELDRYARSPFEDRALYHWFQNEGCACAPARNSQGGGAA